MIRISRIVAKNKIFELLKREYVSKIELKQHKQNLRNPAICKADIYLRLDDDQCYFKNILDSIKEWSIKTNSNTARTTVDVARIDGFIKESAFDDFDYPMPRRYKQLCEIYSQNWMNLFNYGKV